MFGKSNSITVQQLKNSSAIFSTLSERHLIELEAQDAIRTYTLEKDESISFQGGSGKDSYYLLNGSVHFDLNGVSQGLFAASQKYFKAIELEAGQRGKFIVNDPCVICRTDRDHLDFLSSWNALIDNFDHTINNGIQARLKELKNPAVFMRLPFENVEEAFNRMITIDVDAGTDVICQGDTGDTFYIIQSGHAEVWQQNIYDKKPQKVAELDCGEYFGDEALITQGTRNATVKMTESGQLLALHKSDFDALIQQHLIDKVDSETAINYIDKGYVAIDVRHVEEYEEGHLANVKSIPLHNLRKCLPQLDKSKKYLTYCHSGNRGAVAAMIMKQNGFEAVCLKDGIKNWPYKLIPGPNNS